MRFFNRFKSSKGNSSLGLSPLALLTLAACSGGSGGQSGGGGGSFSVGGNVIKGPLTNALVGLDYNGDGVVDSTTVRTGADGSYDISTSNSTYTVIAVTDDQTVDSSSGTVLSGITLKAPKGASVVTPTTTLMEEGGLTSEQVASVLGLPDGVDPTNFNPYASNVDPDHALAVEKASQQVINVVNSFAAAAEGAGASEVDAFKAALNSVAEVVKTKANKINDLTASEADKSLDLTSDADLTLIKTQVKTEITSTANVNSTAFNTLADDTTTAIKNVNNKIETVTDLTSDASKNIFSTTQVLADQVKTAVTAEVGNVGTGNISFTDANEVNTAAINKAPTNITLSSNSISETATSLVIGTLSTTDTDQSSGVAFIYKIAEVTGTDFSSFNINQTTGELSLLAQPDFETKASYNLTVLSTDEGGKTLSKSFIINVVDVNEAPTVANAIADQTFAEDSTLNLHITSSVFKDADAGDSLTYTASLSSGAYLPSWLSFDAATRTFSGTPDNGDVGAIDVMITAADSSSESVSDTFTITITNTNDAPTLVNDISNQTIAEDSALNFQLASNVFADVDQGDSLTYTASLSSGATLPSWLSFNAATQTFSGTPANSDVGTIYVIATGTDSGSQSVSDTFSITITNTNDAPSVANAISNQTFAEDSTLNFQLASNVFSDEDEGDSLSYAATLLSGVALPSWLDFNATTRTFSGTPTNSDVGAIDVMITATDSSLESVSDTFTITITNTNDAPTLVNDISNQTIAEDSALNFQLASNVFADVDQGDILTYSATKVSGANLPSWLSFNAATQTFSGTPTNSDVGTIDVIATATDSGTQSVSDTFSITITNTNDAPEITSTPVTSINEDELYSYYFFYRDVDLGDQVTVSIESKPDWLSFDPSIRRLYGTPENNEVGVHSVAVKVTDVYGATGEQSFSIKVDNQNDAPTLSNAILDQTIAEDNALNFQLASNIFDDVDAGDVLTYSASLANGAALPSWLTFNATSRSFNGTPTNSNIGIIDVQATATDSGSESVSDTFSITVSNTNDAPERLNSTISNNIRWDGHLTSSDIIYRNFSDPDIVHGDSLKYSIEMKEVGLVPSWISINETTGILSVTPPIIDVRENPKTYQLDSYNSSSGEYSATDFLRLQNYFLTVSAEDKVGLTASAELVLAPEALFTIKTNTIEIKDYPKDKPATENVLNTEINYLSDLGNVLTLSSFNLDNDNLQLVKDKNGSSWNTSTWPVSPQLTFELSTFDQSKDFGNLGEISIFLGQVLNASATNVRSIESEEKYIQLNFTGDSELNTNGNLEFTFNPRLEGDIKYQSNASSLEASVSVSENKTLEFIPAENNEPAKLRVNILDLLDQLPFSGAVGALVPFEPGDFYVSIDGLPMETETGDFIDLIDAQFSIV